jgi:probable rRNA maturation factor
MIHVLLQTESHFPVDRKKITNAITDALEGKIKSHAEVGVSIVGDRRMHELNKQFRHVDATTDVLSFPLNDPSDDTKYVPFTEPPDNILRLGDIIVSYPQAVLEAVEENTLVDDQIVFLVLHGLNHLLGIHHEE